MVSFHEIAEPTSREEIKKLETLVGLTLPEAYIIALLANNGGRVRPSIFSFVERGKRTESMVDWFLAVNGFDFNDLAYELDVLKVSDKRMPSQMFPIAYDPGGNLVCISCGKGDYGKVYFWDHEREVDYSVSDDNDYSNLYLIADSFEKFLEGLYAEPKY